MTSADYSTMVRTPWFLVFLAMAGPLVGAMHVGKVPPAIPQIRAELGLTLVAAGWAVSLISLIGALGGIAAGLFSDRVGHARMMKLSLVAIIIGGGLGALTSSIAVLMISRVVEGAATISLSVAAPSLIAGLARARDRNLAISIYSTAVPAGWAVVLLAAPPFLSEFGWRGLWLATGGFAVLLLILDLVFLRAGPARTAARHAGFIRDAWQTVRAPGPNVLSLGFFTYAAQWTAVMIWLPTFIISERDTSLTLAAALTALVVVMNVGGNWLGGVLMHRGVARWKLMAAGTLAMGMTALGFFPDFLPDGLRYILALLFSFLGGLQPAAISSGGPVHAPAPRLIGTTNGYWLQGSQTGQLLGAPVVALVVTVTGGWAAVGPALFLGTLFSLLLALWLRRLEIRLDTNPA